MRARRTLLAATTAAVVGVAGFVWASTRSDADENEAVRRPADLEAAGDALDTTIPDALDAADVPGAAIALVADGHTEWTTGYGTAGPSGETIDEHTVFQVGSLSKPVAAAVITRLADDGDIDIDEPVAGLLSSWQLPTDTPEPAAITLRSLLSHTAGINVGGYLGVPDDEPLPSLAESLDGASSALDGEAVGQSETPGTYRYSGGGYTIAELAVADATGTDWVELAERVLFEPLGMTSTGYGCTTTDEPDPGDARGHDLDGTPTPRYRYVEHAAAGLCSTAGDLARFAAWLASDDPAAAAMRTPADGTDGSYGLGLHLDGPGDDVVAGHEGVNRGFVADLRVVPGSDVAVVVVTNGDGGSEVVDATLDALS